MTQKGKIILIDFDHTLYDTLSRELYSDAREFVDYAKKQGKAILFTEGDIVFQKEKIKKTNLYEVFGEDIRIYKEFLKIVDGPKEFDGKNITIIDDKPRILDEAKRLGWNTIRILRGRHKGKKTKIDPDFIVSSLEEIKKLKLLV